MSSHREVLILPGDGIGPEVVSQAVRLLRDAAQACDMELDIRQEAVGGAAIEADGQPLPEATLAAARGADAVLLGAVGGPRWEGLPMHERPERGLLGLRSGLDLFANLRPAILFAPLADASSLKAELVANLDILIVRELTGGIYFGEPRGIEQTPTGRRGVNSYVYTEHEIERIARIGFDMARKRSGRLCSVDKANVLEVTQLWRDVIGEVAADYADVELSHMYVDNAGMQLVRAPKQFDVIVTGNMFGDILSDVAAMLTGSVGMLPSASLAADGRGLYEPVHGSAPDIAGQNVANPLATMLSVGMMFRYSFAEREIADRIDAAVLSVLESGLRTADIISGVADRQTLVGTDAMADAVLSAFAEEAVEAEEAQVAQERDR
ncbi:MAG: 3-isopropylmalate dehydrogenase [Gammaproteobacteria bacterium]|nr:MAG: 3-isopropylmalate dehydrogenase [Gammaproteobacteria bacterium]TDJ40045.1 MAG: 3-isopropylmalate dehydrogenase [Gammaproteobacteria bacterium]